ncbi:MAG: shikimate dehydrogenase [Pseudomonadota bacterium]
MKQAFVIGFPIHHSKSPKLHGFWLDHYGIDGSYKAVEVEPDNLTRFIENIQSNGFSGGNVTIPHKERVYEIVDQLDEAATAIGAVNTLWFEGSKLCGGNTDAYGFGANLDAYAPDWRNGDVALVIGAGGAARAIVFEILKSGYSTVHIVNRTYSRASALANMFGSKCKASEWSKLEDLLPTADFIVNTTSIGMDGGNETLLPALNKVKEQAIVTDIVYTPLQTPFLKAADDRQLKTVDGLGMLLHQAVPGFERWFGLRPEVTDDLRNFVLGG